MTKIKQNKNESGFALLITILVLGVVVSVTLAIVGLSVQQLNLSVDSTESEIAFHAANAGLECANYTRRLRANEFEQGNSVTFDCFGVGALTVSPQVLIANQAYLYRGELSWGVAPAERCSQFVLLSMIASTSAVTIGGMSNNFSGYESSSKTCDQGGLCTVIAVSGYSSPCSEKNTQGTLKREILLEL